MEAYIYVEEDYSMVLISENEVCVDSFAIYSFDKSVIEKIVKNDYPKVNTITFDF